MKTKIFFIGLLFFVCFKTNAQYNLSNFYGNDVVVSNAVNIHERPRLTVAYNGWMYASVAKYNVSTNQGGFLIMKSTDNGQTWTEFESLNYNSGEKILTYDMQVVGNSEDSLYLFLSMAYQNTNTDRNTIYIEKYNANNSDFIGGRILYNTEASKTDIKDIDIESDYKNPVYFTLPYSIAIAYAVSGPTGDSIKYHVSTNGGKDFYVYYYVQTTFNRIRNISMAYGKSLTANYGYYTIAWDEFANIDDSLGKIYMARNSYFIDAVWESPYRLDSISDIYQNKCKNPSVSCQFSNNDNNESSFSTVIMVENNTIGLSSNTGISAFYNYKSHTTNEWAATAITGQKGVKKQPHITFDNAYGNFLMTYFDSTAQRLPYFYATINNLSTWNKITDQYNDFGRQMYNAEPRVEINPVYSKVAHLWMAVESYAYVPVFDAEYVTSINKINNIDEMFIYPNPARDFMNINIPKEYMQDNATVCVYNSNGQLVLTIDKANNKIKEDVNVSSWNNGVYLVKIISSNKIAVSKFIINH